ncbi:MAG: tetratricopeptide repeat protein, partial [Victivallales bacterium]
MSGRKTENKNIVSPRPSIIKATVKKANNGKPSVNTVKQARAKSLPARKAAPFTVRISAVKEKTATFAVSKKITVKKIDKKASFSRQVTKTVKPAAKKPLKLPAAKKAVRLPEKKDIRKSAALKKTPVKKTDKKAPISRRIVKTAKPSARKTLKAAVLKKTLKTPAKTPPRKDVRKSAAAKKTAVKKVGKKAPLSRKTAKTVKPSAIKALKAAAPKKKGEKPKETFAGKTLGISEDLKKSEIQADAVVISDVELTQRAPELPAEAKAASEETYHSDDAEPLVIPRELVDTASKTEVATPQIPSAGETGADDIPPLSGETAEMHIQDIGRTSLPPADEETESDANIPAVGLKLIAPAPGKRKTRKVILTIALAVLVIIVVNVAITLYKSSPASVEIRRELPETEDVNKTPADAPETVKEPAVAEKQVMPGKSNDAISGMKSEMPEADENEPLPKSLAYVRDQAVQAAREGKFNESLVVIEKLLDIGFAKSSLLSDKMVILVWAEKYYLAIDMFELYRRKNTPDTNLLNAIGTAYRKTGRYNDAIKCCDESLALNKENPDAVKGKVFSMLASGRSFEAYEYIRNEMKNRQNVPVWLNLLTGEAYVVEGKTDEAETLFSEFLKANPGNVFAKRMLAGILVQKKQKLDVAEKMIDEILAVEPANLDLMFLKVTVLQSNKHHLEAYELNEKILSMNKRYRPSLK